jgi:hypothetical protein
MFVNLRRKLWRKRKLRNVQAFIWETEDKITWMEGLLEYEGDTLSQKQKDDYALVISQDKAQIETQKSYIRYIKPL